MNFTVLEKRVDALEIELKATNQALIHLMFFCGLLDNSEPTEEEIAWAKQLVAEGRHLSPSHPLRIRNAD